MYGPRSVTVTRTLRPLRRLVTRSLVPNGSVLCAAVRRSWSNTWPLAVRRPWKPVPYQDATTMALPSPDRTDSCTIDANEGRGDARSVASAPSATQTFIRDLVISRLSFEERNGAPGKTRTTTAAPLATLRVPPGNFEGHRPVSRAPGNCPTPRSLSTAPDRGCCG